MKHCTKCGVELDDHNTYKKSSTRRSSKCRKCLNEISMDKWKQRKLDAIEYKGGKCQVCGYDKHYGALEFHHLDPSEKDCDWGKLRLKNWENIKKELDKCICVCANCHREIHGSVAQQDGATAF
jgi:predicted HNH restriction endonuclease